MIISEFIKDFKEKRIMNTKINEHAVSDYLQKELEIKTYIPFREKRKIAEMIVAHNIKEVDGVKRYDSIDGYIGLVVAAIVAHTNLEFGDDVISDYDLLAESGLLPQIIEEFRESYDEIDTLRKMALAMELEDNNLNVLIGKFLNGILGNVDGFTEALKGLLGNINLKEIFGGIEEEDITRLKGFLDKNIK